MGAAQWVRPSPISDGESFLIRMKNLKPLWKNNPTLIDHKLSLVNSKTSQRTSSMINSQEISYQLQGLTLDEIEVIKMLQ